MNNEAFDHLIRFGTIGEQANGEYTLPFTILKTSEIFKGHFPQQPILPGVVMIEITKRAAEIALNTKLNLVSAGNFKFLKMVDPNIIEEADMIFSITDDEGCWRLKAQLTFNDEIYYKADARYERQ